MNREVTELFLKSTHEKYAQYCGDLFGSVIKGIFTDEPHRGALFNGFGINNANRARMAPYTAALPEAYRKKYGEELWFSASLLAEKGRGLQYRRKRVRGRHGRPVYAEFRQALPRLVRRARPYFDGTYPA